MEKKKKPYYCYLKNGQPVIVEKKPKNFSDLPFHYTTLCPSIEVAKMAYRTNLKIMRWRENSN